MVNLTDTLNEVIIRLDLECDALIKDLKHQNELNKIVCTKYDLLEAMVRHLENKT